MTGIRILKKWYWSASPLTIKSQPTLIRDCLPKPCDYRHTDKCLVLVLNGYGLKPEVWGRVVRDPRVDLVFSKWDIGNTSLCVASPEQANSHSSDASYHGEQGYNYVLSQTWGLSCDSTDNLLSKQANKPQTDGHYQAYYLPAMWLIIMVSSILFDYSEWGNGMFSEQPYIFQRSLSYYGYIIIFDRGQHPSLGFQTYLYPICIQMGKHTFLWFMHLFTC